MSGKSFAVIGLGQFGMTLAKELANADYDVLAIDDKDENIQEIADTVTYAVRADVREPGILKSLGVHADLHLPLFHSPQRKLQGKQHRSCWNGLKEEMSFLTILYGNFRLIFLWGNP